MRWGCVLVCRHNTICLSDPISISRGCLGLCCYTYMNGNHGNHWLNSSWPNRLPEGLCCVFNAHGTLPTTIITEYTYYLRRGYGMLLWYTEHQKKYSATELRRYVLNNKQKDSEDRPNSDTLSDKTEDPDIDESGINNIPTSQTALQSTQFAICGVQASLGDGGTIGPVLQRVGVFDALSTLELQCPLHHLHKVAWHKLSPSPSQDVTPPQFRCTGIRNIYILSVLWLLVCTVIKAKMWLSRIWE